MNLFRSEEHVRRRVLFDPASEDGIRPIAEFDARFGLPIFRERSASAYSPRLPRCGKNFWSPGNDSLRAHRSGLRVRRPDIFTLQRLAKVLRSFQHLTTTHQAPNA